MGISSKRTLYWFFTLEVIFICALLSVPLKLTAFLILLTLFVFLSFGNVFLSLFFFIAGGAFVRFATVHVTQDTLVLIFIFIVFLTNLLLRGRNILALRKTPLNLPLFIFLLFCLAATLRGIINGASVRQLGVELLPYLCFGLFYVVVNVLDTKQGIHRMFKYLVYAAWINSLMGISVYLAGGLTRVGGYLFSVFPSMVAGVLICRSLYEKNLKKKVVYWSMSLPMLVHLVLSFTRGYWIAFLGAILLSILLYGLLEKGNFLVYVGRFAIALLIALFVVLGVGSYLKVSKNNDTLSGSLVERGRSVFSTSLRKGGKPDFGTISNLYRLIEWRESWNKIKEKPLAGHGFGYKITFPDLFTKREISTWFVHQNYLLLALKTGFLGLISFIWLSIAFLRTGISAFKKLKPSPEKGMILGFVSNYLQLLLVAFTNYVYANINHATYLAFVMGAVIVLSRSSEENFLGQASLGRPAAESGLH